VLKRGANPDSLDYHDYLMSADKALYNNYYDAFVKDNMSILEKILSFFKKDSDKK
jgi:hypothetical protein